MEQGPITETAENHKRGGESPEPEPGENQRGGNMRNKGIKIKIVKLMVFSNLMFSLVNTALPVWADFCQQHTHKI